MITRSLTGSHTDDTVARADEQIALLVERVAPTAIERGHGYVIGSTAGRSLAERLGFTYLPEPPSAVPRLRTAFVVWGPTELISAVRMRAPLSRIVWKPEGVQLPLSAAERRLIGGLKGIATTDPALAELLATVEDAPPVSLVTECPPAGAEKTVPTGERALLAAVASGTDAPDALVLFAHLLRAGLQECTDCGQRRPLRFDPSACRFDASAACACGAPLRPLPPLDFAVRLAVRDVTDVDPHGVCSWLGLDRVDIVELIGNDRDELLAWFGDCGALIAPSTSRDLADEALLGPSLGTPTAAHAGTRAADLDGAHVVATRTETLPMGQTRLALDPVAWYETLRTLLDTHLDTQLGERDTA